MGILATEDFVILSTKNSLKCYTLVQLFFGHDMILHIKHNADWGLICQLEQAQINKDHKR